MTCLQWQRGSLQLGSLLIYAVMPVKPALISSMWNSSFSPPCIGTNLPLGGQQKVWVYFNCTFSSGYWCPKTEKIGIYPWEKRHQVKHASEQWPQCDSFSLETIKWWYFLNCSLSTDEINNSVGFRGLLRHAVCSKCVHCGQDCWGVPGLCVPLILFDFTKVPQGTSHWIWWSQPVANLVGHSPEIKILLVEVSSFTLGENWYQSLLPYNVIQFIKQNCS